MGFTRRPLCLNPKCASHCPHTACAGQGRKTLTVMRPVFSMHRDAISHWPRNEVPLIDCCKSHRAGRVYAAQNGLPTRHHRVRKCALPRCWLWDWPAIQSSRSRFVRGHACTERMCEYGSSIVSGSRVSRRTDVSGAQPCLSSNLLHSRVALWRHIIVGPRSRLPGTAAHWSFTRIFRPEFQVPHLRRARNFDPPLPCSNLISQGTWVVTAPCGDWPAVTHRPRCTNGLWPFPDEAGLP